MGRFTVKALKKKFMKFANSEEFPDSSFEWHEYDSETRQVFIWVEGEWNIEIKLKLKDYLRRIHRKLLVNRIFREEDEEDEPSEDYI